MSGQNGVEAFWPTTQPMNFSYEDYFESGGDSTFASIVALLGKYYIPFVVVFGLFGNTISLVVFLITHLNRLSLSVYLAALAISDNGFLLALGIGWLEYTGFPLFHTHGWCQAAVYVSYVTSFLSVWFTVSFTVERYIAICHALHRPEMCTATRAKYIVSSLSVFGLSAYAVSIWTSGVEEMPMLGMPICSPFKDYIQIHQIMIYVDTMVTLIIPFVVILVLNITITHRIAYFYGKKRQMSSVKISFIGRRSTRPKVCLGNKAQVKMTKMMLVISTIFLVVNSPSYIIRLRLFISRFINIESNTSHYEALVQQISQFLFYLNFSINFLLYNICSKKFRDALCRLFWKIRYNFASFLQRSYRILRGSSTRDTIINEIAMRPLRLDHIGAYK